MTTDPALDTLLLPLRGGALAWPAEGRVLFLRARAGAGLGDAPRERLVCQQSFKPFADTLTKTGLAVAADVPAGERFALVLVLTPRQREEARALLACALGHAAAGGTVLAASTNTEGAKSHEADLARLAPLAGGLSKNKARAHWVKAGTGVDEALRAEWEALDAPRPVADARFLSRPGLFAWDRIDPGSALLARHLPANLSGRAADLGAGFGYLSAELLARCPGVTHLDLYEAEARALELARRNLPSSANFGFHWHDVTAGLPHRYDVIVSNPPFHVGRADDVALGQGFITAAAGALRPGGQFWLVANRHLPYEAELAEKFASARTVAEEGGYKIIQAVAGPARGARR